MSSQPRTFEGHMEWEFSDKHGPMDPHSPFARLSDQNKFADSFATPMTTPGTPTTPKAPQPESQAQSQSQPQSQSQSQSQPQPQPQSQPESQTPAKSPMPPSSAFFTPQIQHTIKAPAFRNPAFTTPRNPSFTTPRNPTFTTPRNPATFTTPRRHFDEISFSSGFEESPGGLTDDYCADTSGFLEQTRELDFDMTGALSPTRIDKNARYGGVNRDRGFSSPRKPFQSGKGEISRHPREYSARDVLKKRRRHGLDKDVSGSVRGWDSDESAESETETEVKRPQRKSSRKPGKDGEPEAPMGMITSLFTTLDRHPDAPEKLTKWGLFLLNTTVLGVGVWFVWGIVGGIRHDMAEGIRVEFETAQAKRASCTADFMANNCDTPLPALKQTCADWYNCMMNSPESHMRFKIFAKQLAEVINEFSNTMHLKGWAFFFAILLIIISINVFGRRNIIHHTAPNPQPTMPQMPQTPHPDMAQASPYPHFGVWVPSQAMHGIAHSNLFGANRPALNMDDVMDTDPRSPDGRYKHMLPPPQTPSRRRSPNKQYEWERERSRSPTKKSALRYY